MAQRRPVRVQLRRVGRLQRGAGRLPRHRRHRCLLDDHRGGGWGRCSWPVGRRSRTWGEIDVNSLFMVYDGAAGAVCRRRVRKPQQHDQHVPGGMGRRGLRRDLERRGRMRDLARGLLPPPPQAAAFYFAEGYTGAGFQEYLCLGNPGGRAHARQGDLPLHGRHHAQEQDLRRARALPPHRGRQRRGGADRDVSIKCAVGPALRGRAPHVLRLHRRGRWTGGPRRGGGHRPLRAWYFAEGYTGPGFDEWVCVLNPGDAAADLTFRFQTQEEGEKVVGRATPSPAHSRATFKVNDLLGERPTRPRSSWSRPSRWWPSAPCTSTTRAPAPGTGPGATA